MSIVYSRIPLHISHHFITTMLSKFLKATVCLLMTILFAETANAQILQRLQSRAKEAVERSVERKIEDEVGRRIDSMAEKAVDETFDRIFGSTGSTSENSSTGSTASNRRSRQSSVNFMKRFTDASNITTENEYRFNIITTLEMETIKANGQSDGKMNMVFHYNDNSSYTGTRITSADLKDDASDAMIIYDFKNEVMVMMMNTDNSKFSIAYNWSEALKAIDETNEYSQVAEYNADAAPLEMVGSSTHVDMPNFKHLGTKTISGYRSEGYLMEDDYSSNEIWVTNEIAYGMDRMFEANRSMPAVGNNLPGDYPSGMIMEMTSVDKETGSKFIMRTTEVNKNANVVFRMADYPVMSFSSDR
jgi:hypothetical protein